MLDDLYFHAKSAEGAKILFPFLFTLALEESQTSLRREGAESLSPLRGTLSELDVKLGSLTLIRHKMTLSHFSKGLIHPVSGVESVTTVSTAPAKLSP